jgi:uncharacterized protein (DUF1501 family)
MRFLQPQLHSRRAFLRRSAQLALTGAALPTAMNLAAIGEAAAFNANDYKALVCVFLFGGNDYGNTVVPYDDTSHGLYSAIRTGVALTKPSLAPTLLNPSTSLANGLQFALHPTMTGLAGLFNAGQAAVQLNVGPLVAPTTRTQYRNRTVPLPAKLFSHNDQQSTWQSFATEGSTVGWGGNMGDLALSSNTNSLFTCMSVSGNTVFLSGDSAMSYQVGTGGAVKINGVTSNVYGSAPVRAAMDLLTQQSRAHKLEHEYNRVTARSIGATNAITGGLALPYAASDSTNFAPFTTAVLNQNSLAAQLKMVARLIAARDNLGVKRQVFFVALGGFDMHDGLLNGHNSQLARVSSAMTAFYESTKALGVDQQVTAFTASDFGRTLASNGDGSDHGWGSHHLMVGGAVNGAAFYGSPPPVSVGNSTTDAFDQWHVGSGRLLPSTSVDQYVATMARWFGVEPGEMSGVIPNIGNFGVSGYPVDLGFMKPSA